ASQEAMTQRIRELEAAIKAGDSAREERLVKGVDQAAGAARREVLATCGDDGRFELDALPDGERMLLACADRFATEVVNEKALRGVNEVEIALAPAGILDVDVVDDAGAA